MWQLSWPAAEGAWWFYGRLPEETAKTLIVVMVQKTVKVPPKYLVYWNMHFWFEGDLEGKWLQIATPRLPED